MTTTKDTRYTVDDYKALPEGFPAQLLDGWFVKEPAPTGRHQLVVGALYVRLLAVVGAPRVLFAPFDVEIDRFNVLQPDVLVFAPGVVAGRAQHEIPVLVAEVLSPSTADRDRGAKCAAYLRAGVAEVWLVDPETGEIEVRTGAGARLHGPDDEAASSAIPGFRVTGRALVG